MCARNNPMRTHAQDRKSKLDHAHAYAHASRVKKSERKSIRAHKQPTVREPTNLTLHGATKSRAMKLARELNYELSSLVETVLDKLYEARRLKTRHLPGDYLQIQLFDRLVGKPANPRKR